MMKPSPSSTRERKEMMRWIPASGRSHATKSICYCDAASRFIALIILPVESRSEQVVFQLLCLRLHIQAAHALA